MIWNPAGFEDGKVIGEPKMASDLSIEKILLWQDFTQPNGYRDSLTLIEYPGKKFCYEFNVGGTVNVVPYRHFWERID